MFDPVLSTCEKCGAPVVKGRDQAGHLIVLDTSTQTWYEDAKDHVLRKVSNTKVEHRFVCKKRKANAKDTA